MIFTRKLFCNRIRIKMNNYTLNEETKQVEQEDLQINYSYEHFNQFKQEFIPLPKKTTMISLFLLVVGLCFLINGIITFINHEEIKYALSFLILGTLLVLPGLYYTIQLWKALRANTPEERKEILDDIPE